MDADRHQIARMERMRRPVLWVNSGGGVVVSLGGDRAERLAGGGFDEHEWAEEDAEVPFPFDFPFGEPVEFAADD